MHEVQRKGEEIQRKEKKVGTMAFKCEVTKLESSSLFSCDISHDGRKFDILADNRRKYLPQKARRKMWNVSWNISHPSLNSSSSLQSVNVAAAGRHFAPFLCFTCDKHNLTQLLQRYIAIAWQRWLAFKSRLIAMLGLPPPLLRNRYCLSNVKS